MIYICHNLHMILKIKDKKNESCPHSQRNSTPHSYFVALYSQRGQLAFFDGPFFHIKTLDLGVAHA